MKLSLKQIKMLSEAILSLAFSESEAGRSEKSVELLKLDRTVYKHFMNLLTEEDYDNYR